MKKNQGNETDTATKAQGSGAKPSPTPPPAAAPPAAARNDGTRITPWFLSGTARQANAMRKHVRKILDNQRDILQPNAVTKVETALGELRDSISSRANKATLLAQMENLEKVANDWLKPYPNGAW